jgi:hypothetical protein
MKSARTFFPLILILASLPALAQESFLREGFVKERIAYPVIRQSALFASLDSGRSHFGSYGFKWAPYSLDRSGPALMAISGFGQGIGKVYNLGDFEEVSFLENRNRSAFLVGWQWALPRIMLGVFAGADFESRNDIWGRMRIEGGARLHGEIWSNPTEGTMLTVTAIASTVQPSLWARAAFGWQWQEGLYLGPESSGFCTDDYSEGRYGLHLTGLTLGPLTLRLSSGFWHDSDHRRGLYGQMTGYIRM